MSIGLLSYGQTGNLFNVEKALLALNVDVLIIDKVEQVKEIDALIMPGVGSFSAVIKELQNRGLDSAIKDIKIPVLGICIGMQILGKTGFENEATTGLGIINSDVKLLNTNQVLPHLGFKKLSVIRDSPLLKNIEEASFYFMHSYAFEHADEVQAYCCYGDVKFPAVVQRNNFYGVQFHPEKSRDAGVQLIKNFLEII